MSLPLTRRIAQAALLVAAGAAPLIGAGSASAADLVPSTTDLGSTLTQPDVPNSASTVQGATHELGQAAGTTGAATVAAGVPATADAAGRTVTTALPNTDHSLGKVTTALPNTDHSLGKLTGPAEKTAAVTGALSTVAAKATPALADRLAPELAGKLPSVPGTRSTSATGGLDSLSHALPGGSTVTSALPTGGVPDTGAVTNALPGGLGKALPAADALGSLTGHGGEGHRLGGGVPGLGNSPLDSLGLPANQLTGLIGHLGG
ncbi:hypothetical protein P3T39_000164 [Kitasatospora sp. GP82]|nr:hypothetical protein [Kitasatospora sp. GP82]